MLFIPTQKSPLMAGDAEAQGKGWG